ncbi:MAG: GWxTD domain-containing protein [Candidatus Aminicenantes bacterium]
MKRTPLLILFALFLVPGLVAGQSKVSVKDLPEKYRDWLDLVHYHIQPVEKDVFMKLTGNRDRDIFIETFWKQRDPTPGTPANEYKDELLKRFRYVNEFFGRATVRRGWQTDMGKFYMILGPPASIERFETSAHIVPCQAWSYYGDPAKNLPSSFNLLFYQRGNVGEFRLYDPVSDGPIRLLTNPSGLDPLDYEALYDRIREIALTLADLSVAMVPGEHGIDFSPSPRNMIILADILQSPKLDVNLSYATHFLDYRGMVSTEYMTNFVENQATTALILDPVTGLRFLHFSIVPKTVTMEWTDISSQHYCSYQVNASLRVGEDIVFQYTRDFPVYINESDADRVEANGIAIEDSFPVSEGRFRLIILLINTVGKEFTLVEKDLAVPADTGVPRIEGPFLGYKFETYQRDVHVPFKVIDRKLVADPKNTFGLSEDIAVLFNVTNMTEELRNGGEARVLVRGLQATEPVSRTFTTKLSNVSFGRTLSIPQVLPASELIPDYYELAVSLIGPDGRTLDEKKETFIVSPSAAVSHPIVHTKGFSLANQFVFHYMLAEQAEKLNRPDRAAALYEKAFGLNPEYKEGIVRYANFLLKTREFNEALALSDRLRDDDYRRFEYLSLRGKALMGLEKFDEALVPLIEANSIYNSEIQVLNALGICYQRTGERQKALAAFEASLKLNPEQDDILKLVEQIKR